MSGGRDGCAVPAERRRGGIVEQVGTRDAESFFEEDPGEGGAACAAAADDVDGPEVGKRRKRHCGVVLRVEIQG